MSFSCVGHVCVLFEVTLWMRESGEEEGVSETETEIYCESRVQQRVCVWLGGWIADDQWMSNRAKVNLHTR